MSSSLLLSSLNDPEQNLKWLLVFIPLEDLDLHPSLFLDSASEPGALPGALSESCHCHFLGRILMTNNEFIGPIRQQTVGEEIRFFQVNMSPNNRSSYVSYTDVKLWIRIVTIAPCLSETTFFAIDMKALHHILEIMSYRSFRSHREDATLIFLIV